jgi:tetratricopeptide (TPR) repeat protein
MVHIPEELARSIQAGDCVLWVGAGFGALAGRPTWEQLLERLIKDCPDDARSALEELVAQGRLRTVLTYVHRHYGDEPLAKLLREVSEEGGELDPSTGKLSDLPWRACFATTYADVVGEIFATNGQRPQVLAHNTAHALSLRDRDGFFVLKTPPTGRAMRADSVLFDLVEEVVRSRTILFLGFEPDDPDLVQILDLVDRIGRGNRHFAVLPLMSAPEAEEWRDRFGIEVLSVAEDYRLANVLDDLGRAAQDVAVRPSDVEGALAVLDLGRAVRSVSPRADLATDNALTLDVDWIDHLLAQLPGGSLAGVPAQTLLRTGAVMLAHGRTDRARRCFQQVVTDGGEGEAVQIARFDLALASLVDGDRTTAAEGLANAARSLAVVPPRFEIVDVVGRVGTQLLVTCRDRESKQEVDVAVSTLPRPVGGAERRTFEDAVAKLVSVQHDAVARAKGAFADGRLFGVMYESTPGFVLADTLDRGKPMELAKAGELVQQLVSGLAACHAAGVVHRNLNPHTVVLGPKGALLRCFGFPPIIAFNRPSVREANRGYIAPELLRGGEATPASDTYALAALLYRLLTGDAPSGSVPGPSTLVKVDPRIDPVIRKALHPEASKRLSLDDLGRELQRILETPDLGEAQRLLGAEADAGREEVVDLGRPRADEPDDSGRVRITAPEDPNDLEAWAWILERKPTHLEARNAIERIEAESRQEQRWDRLVEVLGVKAQHAQRQQDKVMYLRELITVFEKQLGAPRNAFESLQTLIEEVEVTEQIELAWELRRLAEITGQWAPLSDSLLIVAERARDPQQQARLYAELGSVFAERLGAIDRALVSYGKAIELEPNAEWIEATLPLHRKRGEHPELAAALLSLADVQTGEDRHATLLSAVRVLREDLGDTEGAFGAVQVVLGEDPDHPGALEQAESMARELEDWDVLFETLSRRADATSDPHAAASLRRDAAAIALQRRDHREGAIVQLTKLTQLDRSDRRAAERLAGLLRGHAESDAAQRVTLIDTLGLLIDNTDAPEDKAALLAEMAALLDNEADGKDRAIDARERILDLLPIDRGHCQAAAEALAVQYRRSENYVDLEKLHLRQATAPDADEAFRARAWEKVFDLRSGTLANEDGSIEALEALTRLQPHQTRWRDDLLARYLEREEFKKAGPLIRAQVFDEKDPKRKAELLLRGGILREQIGKIEGAMEALEEAVSLDPTLTKGWLALRDLYQQNDQPLKAAEALVSAGRNNPNRGEKVKTLFEGARTYIDDLDRPERGLELLEQVVELDPDHRDAMSMLIDRLVAEGDLVRAWPHAQVYAMQVRAQAPNDRKLNLRALSVAGRCALAVDDRDKAREYLGKAKALDATNLDVLRLLGELEMEAENYTEALRSYQSVVLGVGDKMAPGELSRLYVRMADARVGMGEKAKAVQMLERALDIDEDNEEAIDKLIQVSQTAGGPEAVVKAKHRLAAMLERKEERIEDADKRYEAQERRVKLLTEVADLLIGELKMPEEAVRSLEKILEVRPDDQRVLHRILDIFTEGKRWRDATNVLARLAEAQDNLVFRAKYLYAGALILRENLGDRTLALDWLADAVQSDPLHARAFDVYIQDLRGAGKWADITKTLRAHMKALPKTTEPKRLVQLFDQLGEAYEHQGDHKTAVAAYDQSARLAIKAGIGHDEVAERRNKVMRLAISLGEDELDKAVHHGHALIATNPMELEVYHRLVELYLKLGNKDRARAVSKTLKFLKQADEAEEELAGPPTQVRNTITREQWRKAVYHPLQDARLSDLFGLAWPVVAARENRSHAHHNVDRSKRVEVSLNSPTTIARFVAHACQMLDAPVPELYVTDADIGGITVDALAGSEGGKKRVFPSLLVHKDALADTSEPGIKFRTGRAVTRVRPDHILASVLPSSASLRNVVWGAIKLARPSAKVPDDVVANADAYAKLLQPFMQAARLDQLGALADALTTGREFDGRKWLQGVALTANRAGFVLADSLEAAAQALTREGDDGTQLPAKDRIADLVAYSVSEPYLKLRKQLGLGR